MEEISKERRDQIRIYANRNANPEWGIELTSKDVLALLDDLEAAESANAALLKRAEDAEQDTARLDWLERAHFTAYNHRDPENGRLYGACLVDEDQPTRRWIVKKTLRENIDAAKGDSAA